MKILVIGSGGREHALVHTFHRQGHKVYCLPGNAGTEMLAEKLPEKWKDLDVDNFKSVISFCKENRIDLTVCGPEAPLEMGMADAFHAEDLLFFGPSKKASLIECSKAWAKEFMKKYGIDTAEYVLCGNAHEAQLAVDRYFHEWGGVVVKPSGLTAGKGVTVCTSIKEAYDAIQAIMVEKKYGKAGDEVIIEEMLRGREVSIMAFCDGNNIVPMIPAQDHKRLYDKGQGPNTGGIGAYTPTPFLDSETLNEIRENMLKKTCHGLIRKGIDYCGFIYLGLMLTERGPKALEYNCRFGDPEAQAILPLLDSDLAEILKRCCEGCLNEGQISWADKATCCVVMVSRGYPKSYKTGFRIEGLEKLDAEENIVAIHAGTKLDEDGHVVTAGGRVLGITAIADTLEEAIAEAYRGVEMVDFEGAYYRSDIGSRSKAEAMKV